MRGWSKVAMAVVVAASFAAGCAPSQAVAQGLSGRLRQPTPTAVSLVDTLAVPSPGHLSPGQSSRRAPLRLSIAAATHAPLSLGGSVELETPSGLLVHTHLGWMPRAYIDLVRNFANQLGFYDSALGDLVSSALTGSMVLRAAVGWRPGVEEGIELLLGLTSLMAGGTAISQQTVQQALGMAPSGSAVEVPVEATTYALNLAVGVRCLLADAWFLRARIGYTHTLAADASVPIPDQPGLSQQAELLVEDTLTRFGFFPELQFELGYRF